MLRKTMAWVALFLFAGCSSEPAVYNGSVARHSVEDFSDAPRAVYANQIPVYPGARFSDAMGSESWGDEPETYSQGMGWEFEFDASKYDEVIAFYETALPNATRRTSDVGEQIFEIVPAGGKAKETVSVWVHETEFWIHEDVYGDRDEMIRNAKGR